MKTHAFLPAACALLMCSCHGIFDDIYDQAPSDDTFAEGFSASAAAPGAYTLMLDATSYDHWIYVDLHNFAISRQPIPKSLTASQWDGKSGITHHLVEGTKYTELSFVQTDAQTDAEKWDFAVHHFDVKTNGGSAAIAPSSNLADARALDLNSLTFTPDRWTDNQAIVDLKGMLGYMIGYQNSMINPVITDWATMDFSSPPPVYSASGCVYILRMPDSSAAAMQLRSYMSPLGSKGYLTIDIIYPL